MNEEYQGWTNHETWATMLHIDNDQGLYFPLMEVAKQYEIDEIEAEVKAFIEDDILNYDNVKNNHNAWLMLMDIGSLYRVNWREIAEALKERVLEEVNA